MNWPTVREKYPLRWVVVEAITAHSLDQKRSIDDMAIIEEFDDPNDAWKAYKKLHLSNPSRELYVFYTGRQDLEIIEQTFTGIRGLQ